MMHIIRQSTEPSIAARLRLRAPVAALLLAILVAVGGCAGPTPDTDHDAVSPVPGRDIRILHNNGFTLGYDRTRKRAAWVAYQVHAVDTRKHLSRPHFKSDPRLSMPAPTTVYDGPEYDRGHLAPNYAISQLYGRAAQRQTFYYSNVAPQTPRLNQLLWQRLEEIEIDDIAPRYGNVLVIAGPIPNQGPATDGGAPREFFRIWVAREAGGAWQALAFRVPQDVRGDERLDQFLVSVDSIEAATGLDFLAGLDPALQHRLEARPAPARTLGFAQWACEPARYGWRWKNRDGVHLRYDRCRESVQRP